MSIEASLYLYCGNKGMLGDWLDQLSFWSLHQYMYEHWGFTVPQWTVLIHCIIMSQATGAFSSSLHALTPTGQTGERAGIQDGDGVCSLGREREGEIRAASRTRRLRSPCKDSRAGQAGQAEQISLARPVWMHNSDKFKVLSQTYICGKDTWQERQQG